MSATSDHTLVQRLCFLKQALSRDYAVGDQREHSRPAVVRCALAPDPERTGTRDGADAARRPARREGAAGCARGGRGPHIELHRSGSDRRSDGTEVARSGRTSAPCRPVKEKESPCSSLVPGYCSPVVRGLKRMSRCRRDRRPALSTVVVEMELDVFRGGISGPSPALSYRISTILPCKDWPVPSASVRHAESDMPTPEKHEPTLTPSMDSTWTRLASGLRVISTGASTRR